MPRQLKDRIELRRLKRSFSSDTFGGQNKKVGDFLNIDPKWLYQSRLNYRYIFNELNSFWPDWARQQFFPLKSANAMPLNEVFCLNTSEREFFSFCGNKFQVDVTNKGFISCSDLGWGICIKECIDGEYSSFFDSNLVLDEQSSMVVYSEIDSNGLEKMFYIGLDLVSNRCEFGINVKNTSSQLIDRKISIGCLPYTNEGIGNIKLLQYSSNNSLIINDHSVVLFSKQPNDILCLPFRQGDVFNESKKLNMVLNATCSDFLASGLISYQLNLKPGEQENFVVQISYLDQFITPLIYPFKRLVKKRFLSTKSILGERVLRDRIDNDYKERTKEIVSLTTDNQQWAKLSLVIHNFNIRFNVKDLIVDIEDFIFMLKSLMKLNHYQAVDYLINRALLNKYTFKNMLCFTNDQSKLFNFVLIYELLCEYQSDQLAQKDKVFMKIKALIKKDSFSHYIKKISMPKFKKIIHSPKRLTFLNRLFLFFFITKLLIKRGCIQPYIDSIQDISSYLFKLVNDDNDLMHDIIDNYIKEVNYSLDHKLFFCSSVFSEVFSEDYFDYVVKKFEKKYLVDGAFVNVDYYQGYSEKTELLFGTILNEKSLSEILKGYLDHVNLFGNYFNKKSQVMKLSEFPFKPKNYHGFFITQCLDFICYSVDNRLRIVAPKNFKSVDVTNLSTCFGLISVSIKCLDNRLNCITLDYQFKKAPECITVEFSSDIKLYGFSNSLSSLIDVPGSNAVDIPLNEFEVFYKS